MSRPVVWAVVHDLDRTGVPVSLLHLAGDPMVRGAVALHVVAGRDGPLRAAFEAAGVPVVAVDPPRGRSVAGTVAASARQGGSEAVGGAVERGWWRHRSRSLPTPVTIVAHGAGAWVPAAALAARRPRARLVAHLHELEVGIGRSLDAAGRASLVERAAVVAVVCEPVADVAAALGVDRQRLRVVPGSVVDPPGGWEAPGPDPASTTVVSIGEAGWRKGSDRAVAAAHELARCGVAVQWRWVGAEPPPGWELAAGAASPLTWPGAAADPWAGAPPAALVTPSREDPLPLVVLEAGARAVPVVAMATGGLGELLADGRGRIVAQGDIEDLAAAVAAVLDDPVGAQASADALRRHVHDHFRTSVVAPRWLEVVLG